MDISILLITRPQAFDAAVLDGDSLSTIVIVVSLSNMRSSSSRSNGASDRFHRAGPFYCTTLAQSVASGVGGGSGRHVWRDLRRHHAIPRVILVFSDQVKDMIGFGVVWFARHTEADYFGTSCPIPNISSSRHHNSHCFYKG